MHTAYWPSFDEEPEFIFAILCEYYIITILQASKRMDNAETVGSWLTFAFSAAERRITSN